MRRRRSYPQRTCIACRQVREKRSLVRIVRTPEGEIVIDPTGKRSGRGAYLCRARTCWDTVLANNGRQLGQALKVKVSDDVLRSLKEHAQQFPAELPAHEQGNGADAPA
ncbi:MAG: YlxR family protein [Anaerolineae bacterium]